MTIVLVCLVAALAFANGANDNSKGVATLVGFGAARPRTALLYATLATALGGMISFWLAGGLLAGFSTGLFAKGAVMTSAVFVCVLLGACGWVLLATWTGMPVSTTHAIIGALCGAGLVAFGNAKLQWSFLGAKFAMPLAISPVLSLAIVYALAWPVVWIVARVAGRCVCVVETQPVAGVLDSAVAAATASTGTSALHVILNYESNCDPATAVATTSATANAIHWVSGGLISFARGWNDTPKIAALSLFALASVNQRTALGFVIVTVAMAAGGLIAGRRVLETLAEKLTPLPLAESLTASLTTAALVMAASRFALPDSTTHVSTGAIIGAGLKNDPAKVKWTKVGELCSPGW
jgi:PiT family inorganic phosphate transporter